MAVNPPESSDPPEGRDAAGLRLVATSATESDAAWHPSGRPASREPGRSAPRSPEVGKVRESAESDPTDVPRWFFVLTLVVFAGVVFWQVRHAGELAARVAGLEAELARANALVEAQRAHLGEIRGGVHALSERVEALQDLVDRDPTLSGVVPGVEAPVTPEGPSAP